MKHLKIFFISIRNNLIAFALFIASWSLLAIFFDDYIIPSPWAVYQVSGQLGTMQFLQHLQATLYRIFWGFTGAFILGTIIGLISYSFRIKDYMETTMVLFQVLPGIIIGIIFLMIFGIGDLAPIALIICLTTPLVAINTATTLLKKNLLLEQMIIVSGGGRFQIIRDLYIPSLIPTLRGNCTIGMGSAVKIVVLGEFISSENGIGYLLNVSRIYFNMNEVFFYLVILLVLILVFQILITIFFMIFFQRFLYPD